MQQPPRAGDGIAQRWSAFISRPENQAMLIQAGIELMAPMSPGSGSGVARAVGSGFAARDRNITQRMEQERQTQATALSQRELQQNDQRLRQEDRRLDIAGAGLDLKGGLTREQRAKLFFDFLEKRQQAHFLSGDETPLDQNEVMREFELYLAQLEDASAGSGTGTLQRAIPASAPRPITPDMEGKTGRLPDGTRFVIRNGQMVPQ